jgi:hypothetical protein
MAADPSSNHPVRVFKSRAVLVAGTLDFTLGIAVLASGLALIVGRRGGDALPLGLAICVVALILLFTGLGRLTAQLQITDTTVQWQWGFARHAVALADLEDADLVEKGSPASGNSWAGFLGGGFLAVLAWWFVELASAFIASEPTLGPLELVLIKYHGAPVAIEPISAWSTRSSRSQANEALQALNVAIARSPRPSSPRLPILQHDTWDVDRGRHT